MRVAAGESPSHLRPTTIGEDVAPDQQRQPANRRVGWLQPIRYLRGAGLNEGALQVIEHGDFWHAGLREANGLASERGISFSWAPGKVIGGQDYLLQMVVPNTYFHLTAAYAILRHNGVDVGKIDFLKPVNLVAV